MRSRLFGALLALVPSLGLAAPAAITPTYTPPVPGYDIIVMMGQSNETPYGPTLDANIDTTDSRVYQYPLCQASSYYNSIIPAAEPLVTQIAAGPTACLVNGSTNANAISNGLRFARYYADAHPGRRVLIVEAAIGSTSFGNGFWNYGSPTGGSAYEAAITGINGALAAANSQFPAGQNKIVDVLWIQGENDDTAETATYGNYFDAMFAGFTARIPSMANVPWVIGSMAPEHIDISNDGPWYYDWSIPANHPLTAYTGSVPFGMGRGDNLHMGATGQRYMADLMWQAYSTALANVAGTPPVTPAGLGLAGSPVVSPTAATTLAIGWSAPAARTTAYKLQYRVTGSSTWTAYTAVNPMMRIALVTGLTASTSYDFQVASVNAQGQSAWSATFTASTGATAVIPDSPRDFVGTSPGTTTEQMSWNPPFQGGTPTGYEVDYQTTATSIMAAGPWTTAATGLPCCSYQVTGLQAGTSYLFRVIASNSTGANTLPGANTTFPNTTGTTPAPANAPGLSGSAAATTASLAFSAPSAGGGVANAYQLQRSPSGAGNWSTLYTGTAGTFADSGLATSTSYDYRLAALANGSVGPYSSTLTLTTASGPPPASVIDNEGVGVASAYSTSRRLTQNYGGNAFQLTRGSDNTTLTVGFSSATSNAISTMPITTFCATTTCYVTTLYDQSGNNCNLTAASLTTAPIMYSGTTLATINSVPAMDFSSSTGLYLQNTSCVGYPTNADTSIAVVAQRSGTLANYSALISDANNFGSYAMYDRSNNAGIYNSLNNQGETAVASTADTTTAAHMFLWDFTKATPSGFTQVDGTAAAAFTHSASNVNMKYVQLGNANGGTSSPGTAFPGKISEAIVFKVALNSTQISTLRSNDQSFYATP